MKDSENSGNPGEGYLSCGQFAALCKVKKQTLFHYDDIGLLRPAYVNTKGYRYYSLEQYSSFVMIGNLKEAGLSLNEILEFRDGKDSQNRLEVLKRAVGSIERRIEGLQRVMASLSAEVALAEESLDVDDKSLRLMEFPQMRMIRSADLMELDDEEMILAVQGFSKRGQVACAALDVDLARQGNFDAYRYLLAVNHKKGAADGKHAFEYTRPEGLYCVAYHKGESANIGKTYARLLGYCDRGGHKTGALAFEEYLRGEMTTSDESEHLTRICIQILS